MYGQAVTVTVKTDHFRRRTRQMTLSSSTADEEEIFLAARNLAEELLFGEGGPFRIGENVRLLGVGVSKLDRGEYRQMNLFEYLKEVRGDKQDGQSEERKEREEKLDRMLEKIRKKYGENAVRRGSDAPPPGS